MEDVFNEQKAPYSDIKINARNHPHSIGNCRAFPPHTPGNSFHFFGLAAAGSKKRKNEKVA